MLFSQIFENCPGELSKKEVTGVYADSRMVTEGSIFVCIAGGKVDGHDFAHKAIENGAALIVAEHSTGLENEIIVADTRAEYARVCAEFFGNPAKKLKFIGITGTSGKTSSAYMIKSLLEQAGKKVGLIGTIQNIIIDKCLPTKYTTPDAYELHSLFSLMLKAGCEYVVMEVSSQALDQKRVYGLEFDCAVFTSLTREHLDYHGNMHNYLLAKAKLFESAKCAIINIDDEYAPQIIERCSGKVITYSTKDNRADYTARGIKFKPDGVEYELLSGNDIGRVKIGIPGIFSVYNSMTAGIVGAQIGIPFGDVVNYLSEVKGVKGRIEVVPTDTDYTVIIDFAHTPDQMQKIMSLLREVKTGRLITLFGCGGDRDRTKRPVMGSLAAELSDFVVVTSDNPRSEQPEAIVDEILTGMTDTQTPYEVIVNREQAIEFALNEAKTDDIVLLAGKGHETYQILKDGTIHFDEREVIARILSK